MIRVAHADDLPHLQQVERAASTRFCSVGMSAVSADDPASLDHLQARQQSGQLWLYVAANQVVAFLLLDRVDGYGHIEEVSVHPSYARRGIGRQLIETASYWAQGNGLAGLTLTTFADVPWNAPYYERLGFQRLRSSELSEGLRAIRRGEDAKGLDAWPRVAMRRLNPDAFRAG